MVLIQPPVLVKVCGTSRYPCDDRVAFSEQLSARDQPLAEEDVLSEDEFTRRRSACTVFLGYTSNMSSAGVRDNIRFLVQHRMVSDRGVYL